MWYRDALMAMVKEMETIAIAVFSDSTLGYADAVNVNQKIVLNRQLRRAINAIASKQTDAMSLRIAKGMTGRSNQQNKQQMIRNVKRTMGVDITGMLSDDVIAEQLQLALEENLNLIKSIQDDFKAELGNIVRGATMGGERHENLVGVIVRQIKQDASGSQLTRAKMVARDQVSKLNSDFSRIRNEALGIQTYRWLGTGDARERESHKSMNNLLCRYDDATVYSDNDGKTWKKRTKDMVHLHPGEDILCRCQAMPEIKWD